MKNLQLNVNLEFLQITHYFAKTRKNLEKLPKNSLLSKRTAKIILRLGVLERNKLLNCFTLIKPDYQCQTIERNSTATTTDMIL